jgi:hypothetical protein
MAVMVMVTEAIRNTVSAVTGRPLPTSATPRQTITGGCSRPDDRDRQTGQALAVDRLGHQRADLLHGQTPCAPRARPMAATVAAGSSTPTTRRT